MKTRILTSILCLAALSARAQYPAPGPTPLFRGAGLNGSGSLVLGAVADLHTFTPEGFRVSTDTDDTNSLQAAINAACAAAPAKVLLSRVYNISGAITGTVPAGNGITIEGLNRNCGIMTSLGAGDVLLFAPSGTPSTSSLSTGLRWMTFKDFFVDSSVTRTSGAAFHIQWSDSTSFINVRIGTFNVTLPGTQLAMYDGIYMDKQSNCSVTYPQIYCSNVGFTTTGASASSTGLFAFGGYIGGGGYMYGNYATPSVGIHIAGQNGGFELGDFDCGQWGRYALLVDDAIATGGNNHELFIGRCFLDSAQICGCYIASNSLNILHLHNAWIAGSGYQSAANGDGSREVGCGLYIQAPQSTLHLNISSGTHIYSNGADGVCIGDCLSAICEGADIYYNGVNYIHMGTTENHGVEVLGGNNVVLMGNNLTLNVGASFITRLAGDTVSGGTTLGVTSYMIFGNDGGGSGYPLGIEENASARTANQYAGFTLGGSGNVSNGPFPAQFTLGYNAASTTVGPSLGVNSGTARLFLPDGTASQAWTIDNSAGIERHYLGESSGGLVYEQLSSSGMSLLNGAGLTIQNAAADGGATAYPSLYSTTAVSASNIDWASRGPFTKTISANTTFTFSNQADGQEIKVAVTNTGTYTVTWPTVNWVGAVAPTQTTGAHTDVYTFRKIGSNIYGSAVQNY